MSDTSTAQAAPKIPWVLQRDGGPITGRVDGLQQRLESRGRLGSVTVWDFRVARIDERGQALHQVPVEIRGTRFKGSVAAGDFVEISHPWKPGQLLQVRKVKNLSTGVTFQAKGFSPAGEALRGLFILTAFALVVAVILHTAFH